MIITIMIIQKIVIIMIVLVMTVSDQNINILITEE